MTTVRRILAAAVVAGTLAVLPISGIASQNASAAGFGSGPTVTLKGGQGPWPI